MADGIVRLTRLHNHARADVMKMTPRELLGVLAIADRQYLHDTAAGMQRDAMAARGDPEALQRECDKMTREV